LLEGDEAELRMRALFDSIDVDRGGTIDKDEMRDGLKRLGKSKQALAQCQPCAAACDVRCS
jgi:Ca2+-binding EF-hand superfamily protein